MEGNRISVRVSLVSGPCMKLYLAYLYRYGMKGLGAGGMLIWNSSHAMLCLAHDDSEVEGARSLPACVP